MMLLFKKQNWLVFGLLLVLTACGGGGSSDSSGDDDSPWLALFIDSGVAGLEYSSTSYQGVTGANGEFEYNPGETTTFSYNGLRLGSVALTTESAAITPLDLFSTTDVNNQAVKNTLVFLQTLDYDQIASNGLQLPIGLTFDLSTFDITSASFQSDLLPVLIYNFGDRTLVAEQDALDHFNNTLISLNATTVLDGRWITRDTTFGDVGGVLTFMADGSLDVIEFEGCANDTWASTEALANRTCSEFTISGSWSLDGRELTMTSADFSDSCIIISSSSYAIEASCRFSGSGLGSEFTRFERDITSLSNALVNNRYHEFSPDTISFTRLIFNSDLTGSYQFIDENGITAMDDTGDFNWSTSSSQLSVSGIDGAGENFADAFDLVEAVRGALSTNGKMSVLIPDFDSSLMEGIFSYSPALENGGILKVHDAIDGSCKNLYIFGEYNYDNNSIVVTNGGMHKVANTSGNPNVCGDPPSDAVEEGFPFSFELDGRGAIIIRGTAGGGGTQEICWPISFSTTTNISFFAELACSVDGAPFAIEIWRVVP
jgi:hypothetical protein